MTIRRTKDSYKKRINLLCIILFSILFSTNILAQAFEHSIPLTDETITKKTGEKPQSKVWYHAGKWWAVLPNESGTYVWRLDNTTWTNINLLLENKNDTKADCLVDGDTTHILLYRGQNNNKMVSIEYVSAEDTYMLWSQRSSVIDIDLDSGVETAVIDIDNNDVMWLANEGNSKIYVRWSAWPYASWYNDSTNTDRYQLNSSDVDGDDICDITTFGGNKIGVLWSNQVDKKFYFKYHYDGDNGSTWSTPEIAAEGDDGNGVADDHINFAVGSDGTIYAAVKTSYDDPDDNLPEIALLIRRPDGTWDDIYAVTLGKDNGTRGIVILNETEGVITVLYTNHPNTPRSIRYKQSSTGTISFGNEYTLIDPPGGVVINNVTSTKQNFTDDIVILASNSSTAFGVIAYTNPLPVELSSFTAALLNDKVVLNWRTETEVNNYGFNIERSLPSKGAIWATIAFVEGHGNSNSPKEYTFNDGEIEQSGNYSYRLKQIDNDGTFEYSDVVTVYVGTPEKYYLSQNYPNPFNPTTTIDYTIPQDEKVSLKVYDLLGREVASLVDEFKPSGTYSVTFDAEHLASGVYIYRIIAGEYVAVNRMSLLK